MFQKFAIYCNCIAVVFKIRMYGEYQLELRIDQLLRSKVFHYKYTLAAILLVNLLLLSNLFFLWACAI